MVCHDTTGGQEEEMDGVREGSFEPVTLEDEKGCSILDSSVVERDL